MLRPYSRQAIRAAVALAGTRLLQEKEHPALNADARLTAAQREQAALSPVDFAEVCSGGWYKRAPHLELLNEKLLDLEQRKIKRLMIFMPPRHAKSETASHFFASWYLGKHPDHHIILTSYGAEKAADFGRAARDTLTEFGPAVFDVSIRGDSDAAHRWQIAGDRGGMFTSGIRGAITGRGADCFIIDDPVKDEQEAWSAVIQAGNASWWESVASTRLEPDAVVILIMTRWHLNDLAGYLLSKEGQDWDVLELPAEAIGPDVLGRRKGDFLWEDRFSHQEMVQKKTDMVSTDIGAYYWAAMYQQQPSIPAGLLYFDKDAIDYIDTHEVHDPRERWDTRALPTAPSTGYVVVWERPQPRERYVIGADTADGKGEAVGTWSAAGGPDRNAAAVYRVRDGVQVAEIYGRQEEHEYARVLNEWGRAYNNAMLCVERNRRAVLSNLLGLNYPNLWYSDKPGDLHLTLRTELVTRRREWGWNTDVKSRPLLLAGLREALTTGVVKPRSADFVKETRAFVMGDPPQAAPGTHDDLIFAHALAVVAMPLARQAQSSVGSPEYVGGMR